MEVKKMRNQKGKVNISSILITAVLVYGGFVAYKIIASGVTKSQVKNEIIEKFGFDRGTEFTPQRGREIIQEILIKHDLYSEGVVGEEENESESSGKQINVEAYGTIIEVEIRQRGTRIWYSVDYTDEINLLFFKMKKRYSFEHEMLNYN
jgi:hypothetical protein